MMYGVKLIESGFWVAAQGYGISVTEDLAKVWKTSNYSAAERVAARWRAAGYSAIVCVMEYGPTVVGCRCKVCNNINPQAEPNQSDGSYICYECR